MRALVKAQAEPGLWLQDVQEPQIGINDVLIRVDRTGICGTDLHISNWDAWAQKTIPVGLVIGHEFVGDVVAVGENVTGFSPGDLVSGEGHLVCGRCRNCMAGRRHLCAHTEGIGVSAFPSYSTNTGSYFVSYSLVAPFEIQVNGHKRVVYGLFAENPYFFENRNGASLIYRLGDRIAIRGFGDVGDNEYPRGLAGGPIPRVDDVVTVGGGFAIRLYRTAALTIVVSQSEFDSNIDQFDRSVVRVQSGISFGGFPR